MKGQRPISGVVVEDRSVRNTGVIQGNVSTGDTTSMRGNEPAEPSPRPAARTSSFRDPRIIAAVIAAAAALGAAIIGLFK